MENNKEVENEVLNVYPKIFNFDNSFLWSVKFNIVKEYCMIGSGIAGNEYFEVMQYCTNAHYRLALTATPFMKSLNYNKICDETSKYLNKTEYSLEIQNIFLE